MPPCKKNRFFFLVTGFLTPDLMVPNTYELGFNLVENPEQVHDFEATLMHLLGVDEKFTFKHQRKRFRLTDVHGKVVDGVLE